MLSGSFIAPFSYKIAAKIDKIVYLFLNIHSICQLHATVWTYCLSHGLKNSENTGWGGAKKTKPDTPCSIRQRSS